MIPIIIPMPSGTRGTNGGGYSPDPSPEQLDSIPAGEFYAAIHRDPGDFLFPWTIAIHKRTPGRNADEYVTNTVAQFRWTAIRSARRMLARYAASTRRVEIIRAEPGSQT